MHIITGKFYSYDFVLGGAINTTKNELDVHLQPERQGELVDWKHLKKNVLDIEIGNT